MPAREPHRRTPAWLCSAMCLQGSDRAPQRLTPSSNMTSLTLCCWRPLRRGRVGSPGMGWAGLGGRLRSDSPGERPLQRVRKNPAGSSEIRHSTLNTLLTQLTQLGCHGDGYKCVSAAMRSEVTTMKGRRRETLLLLCCCSAMFLGHKGARTLHKTSAANGSAAKVACARPQQNIHTQQPLLTG